MRRGSAFKPLTFPSEMILLLTEEFNVWGLSGYGFKLSLQPPLHPTIEPFKTVRCLGTVVYKQNYGTKDSRRNELLPHKDLTLSGSSDGKEGEARPSHGRRGMLLVGVETEGKVKCRRLVYI